MSDHALQVRSFGDIQQNRVIFGLTSNFEETHASVGVKRGRAQHFKEAGLAHVIGARAGDEYSARPQHLKRAKVEFFVAAESGIEIAFGFGEGGRIEHDGVVRVVGGGVVLKQVEGVGFDPFDLSIIQGRILVGDFQRGTRAVDAR